MKQNKRRAARCLALNAVYQWLLSGNPPAEIEQHVLEDCDTAQTDVDYFKALFSHVTKHADECDQLMQPYLDRSIKELTPIERCVLYVAIGELKYRPDVPYRVVINEALELTKEFGAAEGFKYVNGILDKVARSIRKDEIKS